METELKKVRDNVEQSSEQLLGKITNVETNSQDLNSKIGQLKSNLSKLSKLLITRNMVASLPFYSNSRHCFSARGRNSNRPILIEIEYRIYL